MSHAEDHEGTRRDFLYYVAGGAGVVATGAAVWPLINQMNPSADVQALSSIRVDVSGVEPGTQLTVKWLGKPVFIRHRTGVEIQEAQEQDADGVDALPDPLARNFNLKRRRTGNGCKPRHAIARGRSAGRMDRSDGCVYAPWLRAAGRRW